MRGLIVGSVGGVKGPNLGVKIPGKSNSGKRGGRQGTGTVLWESTENWTHKAAPPPQELQLWRG